MGVLVLYVLKEIVIDIKSITLYKCLVGGYKMDVADVERCV